MERYETNRENNRKMVVLTYILLFAILYGVCNTHIYYSELIPFGIGMVFALLYIGFNGYYLSIVYCIAYSLAGMNILALIEAVNVVLVLVGLEYFRNKRNFRLKKWQVYLFSILAQVVYVVSNIGGVNENLALAISILLGMLFLYSNLCFLNATFNRGMIKKLNLDEKICGGILLIIFMIGMSCINISIINLGFIMVSLIILVATYLSHTGLVLIVSALMGISFSITTLNPIYISLFIFMGICSITFKCNFKYFSILSTVIGYIVFSLFFNTGISFGEIISIILGGIVFAFIPLRVLSSLSEVFNIKSQVIFKNILNKNKKQIMNRVQDLSRVFADMDQVYRDMVRGTLEDNKAIEMLKGELVASVCGNCPNKDLCYRDRGNFLDSSIDTIVSIGYEKGKILLIDVPAYLTSNCMRINQMIGDLNTMLLSYKEYTGIIGNMDMSRILIADQLSGVSQLLLSLSKEVDCNISFDNGFESRIVEELNYRGIICLECMIYEKDINNKDITLIVNNDNINDKIIEKYVSKIVNNKMMIKSKEISEIPGAIIISMVTMPNYDIAFGSSSLNKHGKRICGDSQSLIKIDDGKYLISICDGMGSGESAHSISSLTVKLIENFYRAGFDNDIIINSVNKLLSLTEEENFSTIDLCVIDGKKNIYDFIKLGATSGYIKRNKGECEEIKSNGLPVGVLEDITPHVTKKLISPFDMLVFVSDGISDSFRDKEDLRLFINSQDIINPQTLSDVIIGRALELNDGIAIDDMTVICVRVFSNV